MKKILMLLAIPAVLLLAGCQKSASKPEVVTTFEPMYEFTKAIVGDKVDVENIVPANQEVHEFEPSAKQVATMTNAEAIVYNSNDLEKWAKKVNNKELQRCIDSITHPIFTEKALLMQELMTKNGVENVVKWVYSYLK